MFDGNLNSPTRVINEQTGNSLEMSLLLVSLLRGFGWEAYVVVGWVDGRTASLDQSGLPCPLLDQQDLQLQKQEEEEKHQIYKLRKPLDLTSKYQGWLYLLLVLLTCALSPITLLS